MADVWVQEKCYHCGEDCIEETIHFDEKAFCCQGCKTVYEILDANKLGQYYTLENAPGISQKDYSQGQKFAFLDHAEIADKLYDFQDANIKKVSLYIPAIHCSSCIWLLENLQQLQEGICHTSVQFLNKKLSITFNADKLNLRALAELLAGLGYAPEITLAESQNKKASPNRSLAVKIGLAGFCFGNTMLLSLPEYLDTDFSLADDYKSFFAYLNLLLALPVFFYAASDYIISAWKGLRHRFINIDIPIALGIFALFGRSTYEILSASGPGYMDSLCGLVFFLLIGKWYQSKTYQALSYDRDYASYFPVAVSKINDDKEQNIPLKDVQVGDQLIIRNQELIPADAILLKGAANIDYSFVSGEAVPVQKSSGDKLYAGGRQVGSSITVEVSKAVANSYLTELWNQDVFSKDKQVHLSSVVDVVSKYFTIAILCISFLTAVYWLVHDSSMLINTVTAVLIVACPCALALTLPFTFGHSMRALGKRGLYLKNTQAIELLSKISDIIFDKTGTITQSKPQQLKLRGTSLSTQEKELLRSAVQHSTHPLSKIIYQSLPDYLGLNICSFFEEIPGKGIHAIIGEHELYLGSESYLCGQSSGDTSTTRVYLKIDGVLKGYYEFDNLYRPGFSSLMHQLSGMYKRHLLSGDNDREKEKLAPYFEEMHFRQSPLDKLEYLKKLDSEGKTTLMLGDGLNDAGALKQSSIGIAVADNIYHFSPACDAILDAQKLKYLDRFLAFTQSSMRVIRGAFLFSFLYNLLGLSFAVSGMLTPLVAAILMPLSSVTVVGFITLAINVRARKLLPPA
ncbi:heavy metal translocating P-type ATPase metal-binding domain-containing protein [Porifericola rhodea]|uniref:heavy metal translocating P-type ATPase n=1 Tax=Porifericola rhodea TaxID=930972 RepID=UPI002666DCD9|nr:heavy metal translocating P-type ATPase metal-binding domain-containing protein [Porifericola rhodea]WKN31584.1 heavy metal translocating P-type ATPase metal-binding domain-containing protein [Porifericola rhodea]